MDEMDEISESWVDDAIHLAGVRIHSHPALVFAEFRRLGCYHFGK